MAAPGPSERALMAALDEPALIVEGGIVWLANRAAQKLLGTGIEGRDVRLAIGTRRRWSASSATPRPRST